MDLEDDMYQDFNGTLRLTDEEKNNEREHQKYSDNKFSKNCTLNETEKNTSEERSNIIASIASLPKQLKETLWNTGSQEKESTQNTKVIKPAVSPIISGNPMDFFTFRESVVEHAIQECIEQFLDVENDGPLLSAFLVTEISLWDTDKERLVLVTSRAVIIVKYDFIALKRLGYKKIPLENIDTIMIGDLTYPPASLVPQLQGLVDGLSCVVHKYLFDKSDKSKDTHLFDLFNSRNRNTRGIRLMWNKGKPVNFIHKWNPLNNEVPFVTLTSHPLLYHKDCTNENQKKMYDIENFIDQVCLAVTDLQRINNNYSCIIIHKEILLDNYIGLGSLIHNRNALGYFKVRGKLSF